jgi:prolyl-tRNA synthetase
VERIQQRNMDLSLEIYKHVNTIPLFKDEIMLDDRVSERPNLKLRAASVIGYPITIVVGKEYNEKGLLEVNQRKKSGNSVSLMTTEETYNMLRNMSL